MLSRSKLGRLRSLRLVLLVLALPVAACDASGSAGDAASVPDAGASDARVTCSSDRDCDDGAYCTGVERCAPADPGANALGCVRGTNPCTGGRACDEVTDACASCAVTDADGDGHTAVACGGDDCDDGDADRYPSNPETCDGRMHDEDCDPSTYGVRDADADGADDAVCCNADDAGAAHCGTDCNDAIAAVHPGASEVCDAIDDDCDLAVDEGLAVSAYAPDCDGDGFGSALVAPQLLCGPPSGPPCASGGAWSTMPTDCDDTLASRSPVATETCNGGDDDCDGAADEASAAASCALAFGAADMACERGSCLVASCVDGRGDCDGVGRNGCEIDLTTNAMHCSACGMLCVVPNATAECRASACAIGTCNSGFHECGLACVSSSAVATCGSACTPCAAGPAGSHTTCDGVRCGWACDPGNLLIAGACVPGPRPVFPPNGSRLTIRRLAFSWELAADQTGALLEVCADRACTSVLARYTFTGTTGTPTSDLPAGLFFYRLRGVSPSGTATVAGTTFEVIGPRTGASTTVGTAWGSIFDPNGDGRMDVGVATNAEVSIYPGLAAGGIGASAAPRLTRPSTLASNVIFGYQVGAIGDVNGDGYIDVGVGQSPSGLGVVLPFYVYYGGPAGIPSSPSQTLWSPLGGSSQFGLYGYGTGDVDRDGYADLAIGDARFSGSSSPGWVHLFRGGPTGLESSPSWSVSGPTRDFGTGVGVADFNCDGRADVVVSAPSLTAGRPLQVYYATGRLLPLGSSQDLAPVSGSVGTGSVLTVLGDVTGSGCPDFAASTTTGGGTSLFAIWAGTPTGFYAAGWEQGALNPGASPPYGIGPAGDVDGDGLDEWIVWRNSASTASVYSGLDTATPAGPYTTAGAIFDAAPAGDVDRDGFADVLFTGSSGTYLHRGQASGLVTGSAWSVPYNGRDVD